MLMDTHNWSSASELETLGVQHQTETSRLNSSEYQFYGAENGQLRLPEWNDSTKTALFDFHSSPVHFEHPVYEFEVTYESPLINDGDLSSVCDPAEPLSEVNKTSGVHYEKNKYNFDFTEFDELEAMKCTATTDENKSKSILGASSPGSKENFCDKPLSYEWHAQTDGIYDDNDGYEKSFQSVMKIRDSALAAVITGRNTGDSKTRNANHSISGTDIFNQHAIHISKPFKNISCEKNILKLSQKPSTNNCQQSRDVRCFNSKQESKLPSASKVSCIKALNDHEYSLKIKPSSVPSKHSNGILKRSSSVPSFLELLLRCRTKLNPNLGSDCLLSNRDVHAPLHLNYKNVKEDGTKRKGGKNKSSHGTPIDRSKLHASDCIINGSADATRNDGDKYKTLFGDDVLKDVLKMESCSSLHPEQMGVDHILTDGFGLNSYLWADGELHSNGFDFFENVFHEEDVSEEHSDWLQEEQRQEDEYLKSYLRKL